MSGQPEWVRKAQDKSARARKMVEQQEGKGDESTKGAATAPAAAAAAPAVTQMDTSAGEDSVDLSELQAHYDALKAHMEAKPVPVDKAEAALTKLKIGLIPHGFLTPTGSRKARLLARDTLELAALLSVEKKELASFERHMAQLKTYYQGHADLPQSQHQWMFLGLNLLCLLAQNSIAQFHTQLELIPEGERTNAFIQHPIKFEQYIMEGSFSKVLKSQSQVPHASYQWFTDKLLLTVRDEIADCLQQGYETLSQDDAQSLLHVKSTAQVQAYADARQWKTTMGGDYDFSTPPVTDLASQIPQTDVILQTLNYAMELEKIV